jgi:hypothetical protein
MPENTPDLMNPNTAEADELECLPGVGPALAQRILEARPFADLEDMRRVRGLGKVVLGRLAPHLRFATLPEGQPAESTAATTQPKAPDSEATPAGEAPTSVEAVSPVEPTSPETPLEPQHGTVEAEPPAVLQPIGLALEPPIAAPPPPSPKGSPPAYSRREVQGLVVSAGLASLLLSIILSLTILAGLNGTLNFGRHRSVRQLQTDLATLQSTLGDVSSRLQAATSRLDALEGLSGRMTTVEDQVNTLQTEIDGALSQVQAMQTSLDELVAQNEALSRRTDRFDSFLDGLLQLLSPTVTSPSSAPTLAPTPMP